MGSVGLCLLGLSALPAWIAGLRQTADSAKPWSAPDLERAISIRRSDDGAVISFQRLLEELSQVDAVFVGETHLDETTHRVEFALYQGLSGLHANVVLGMEMFERDSQPALDSYLAREIDEEEFLERVSVWSNYATAYRPLIEAARARRAPVIASNFPSSLRRRMAMEGNEVLETLDESERHLAPATLYPNTPEYWRRVDNAIRSHRGMMSKTSGDQRLYSTQTLWDNAMGEACALALDEHPGGLVLHVNGGFHSAYHDGTVRQFALRRPEASIATVAIQPAVNPGTQEVGDRPQADYTIIAESRASDVDDGAWSVTVGRALDYRLHTPPDPDQGPPRPLLIWWNDDGLEAADGIDLWRGRIGEEAWIAVLEPVYPAVQPDLSTGGRWFWPDTFTKDVSMLLAASQRTWAYLLRHLPIDPNRVCVAGEGTGATVAAAVALLSNRMHHRALAIRPARYARIKDFPLPLPEYRDRSYPEKSLRVIGRDEDQSWWQNELLEYQEIGLDTEFVTLPSDQWQEERFAENAIRVALGLPQRQWSKSGSRAYLHAGLDTPRNRHWLRLRALQYGKQRDAAVAVVDVADAEFSEDQSSTGPQENDRELRVELTPEAFQEAGMLPQCPGPFGGTTVLVVDDRFSDVGLAAWQELEANDPLNKESRFHRLRVATPAGDHNLPAVLRVLQESGRKNVLIIPATFCADSFTMQQLQRSVRDFSNQMTLHWLPGLGGRNVMPQAIE